MKPLKHLIPFCKKNYKGLIYGFVVLVLLFMVIDLKLKEENPSDRLLNVTKTTSEEVAVDFDQFGAEGRIGQATPSPSSMFVKNASIDVKVKSVDEFEAKALQWQRTRRATLLSASFYRRGNVRQGSISMRIDKNDFENLKAFLKKNSVEITRFDVYGHDILDSYNDDLEQLKLLEATKEKIQSFYNKADDVKSLMAIQRELLNVEQQIATVNQRIQNAEIQSKTMVVTIYVSTDESYKPVQEENWKPVAVIKEAWASLVKSLVAFVNMMIWLLVYSVIWLPLTIIGVVFWKKKRKTNKSKRSKK